MLSLVHVTFRHAPLLPSFVDVTLTVVVNKVPPPPHFLSGCHWESVDYVAYTPTPKGRCKNTSVETGNFLQKNVKCMLVEYCRSVTPSPHVRVKGHLGDDSKLLLYNTNQLWLLPAHWWYISPPAPRPPSLWWLSPK